MNDNIDKVLRNKAEVYCSAAERCPADVEKKLLQWGADEEAVASVMQHLFRERYLDALRYCRFFVRDKYRFNQWGRMKISQALRMKQMSAEDIQAGLEEIDEEEYMEGLKRLLNQKRRSVKARNEYELNTKLIRYAVGKGFTMSEVLALVKEVDPDEYSY